MTYKPQQYRDLYSTSLGQDIWRFLNARDNIVRLETASFLRRPAVEPLSPHLLERFGSAVKEPRVKQMIGHMTRQVMQYLGYEIARTGVRITQHNLFSSGTRYSKAALTEREMQMQDRKDIKYGRYRLIAGTMKSKAKALAYIENRMMDEFSGANVEEALAVAKAALDARDKDRKAKRREPYIATVDEFEEALETIGLADHERIMLRAHANAPNRTMTATQIASAAGYESYSSANAQYGNLAKRIGEAVGISRPKAPWREADIWTLVLAHGEGEDGAQWRWTLHEELAEALDRLNLS